MGTWISYKGRVLGKITLDDNNTGKFVFVAEGLEALAELFRINPNEQVEVEDNGSMNYSKFTEKYFKGSFAITGFYPTPEDWLLKNNEERTMADFDKKS